MQRNRILTGRAVFVLLAFLLALAAVSPAGRAAVVAVLLLPHFFPGDVARPLRLLTPQPVLEHIEVPGAPGRMVADIYRPGGSGPHPAMVLLLGVNPLPRGSQQVVRLADGIARAGIVTVVAESEALVAGEIRTEEIDNLVALFTHLEHDPGVDPRRIGFSGFCVGAILELLAASDARIADRVAFVNAFSVYAETLDVLRAILTQSMPTPAGPVRWVPAELTRTVFLRHTIAALPTPQDRSLLERELLEENPLTAVEVEALTPAGRQVRELLTTRDPQQIDDTISTLPADVISSLEIFSPKAVIHRLRATTFLMHDQNDTYLPVAGARQLASALPREAHGSYTEFRLFAHVVPEGIDDPVLFVREMLKLVRHIQSVVMAAWSGRVASS